MLSVAPEFIVMLFITAEAADIDGELVAPDGITASIEQDGNWLPHQLPAVAQLVLVPPNQYETEPLYGNTVIAVAVEVVELHMPELTTRL